MRVCPACENPPPLRRHPLANGLLAAPLFDKPFIEIDRVTFGYDSRRTILSDLSLQFPRGKVTAILGGSGCGKTTLMRLVCGVHAADEGRVVFDGEAVNTRDAAQLFRLRRRLGMLLQFGALF